MKRCISRLSSIAAGLGAALLLGLFATPSLAQGGDGASSGLATPDPGYLASLTAPVRSVRPSRLRTEERREFDAADMELRRLEMDDSLTRADIAAQLETADVACGVSGFKRIGTTPEAKSIYEAACDAGPGYVIVNGVEPQATSCLVLAGASAAALRRDPRAVVGAQCTLPENQNGLQVIGGWARDAGVACTVDQAEWLGSSDEGFDVYEVGCVGTEGFWLEEASSGWSLKGCIEVDSEGLDCRFTDAGEQHAWMRATLAGTSAQACEVAEIRMVGVSSQGRHYEARCSDPGQGYLVRIARDGKAEDVTSCAAAVNRRVGCALTIPSTAGSAS